MVRSFWQDVVTRRRGTVTKGSFGNDDIDFTDADEIEISRTRIKPLDASELNDRRTGAKVTHLLQTPHDADIKFLDRIAFEGTDYDVVLPPEKWRGVSGAVAHLNVEVREVIG